MSDGTPGDGVVEIEDVKIPDGYTLIEDELLRRICELSRPAHQVSALYEEVAASLKAGQPHPAAMVAPEEHSGLQLVDGRGQQVQARMQWVGLAIAKEPLRDMHEVYAALSHEPEFRTLLEDFEMITSNGEPADG